MLKKSRGFAELQAAFPSLQITQKTKNWFSFMLPFTNTNEPQGLVNEPQGLVKPEIYVGRNQQGNQQILDILKSESEHNKDTEYWWFHLDNSTSAHVILCTPSPGTGIFGIQWIFEHIFCKHPETIVCALQDVECTKTPGLVKFKNEQRCSEISRC
jgi:hypothetical protein